MSLRCLASLPSRFAREGRRGCKEHAPATSRLHARPSACRAAVAARRQRGGGGARDLGCDGAPAGADRAYGSRSSSECLSRGSGHRGPVAGPPTRPTGKGGLVVRKEDPTDRRAKVLSLTPAGKKVVAGIEADLHRLRDVVFASVSAADLEASMRVFRVVLDHGRTVSEVEDYRAEASHVEAAQ